MAERGCLLLVAVDDEDIRGGIVAALKEHLDGQVDLSEHSLDPTYPSLGAYLRTLPSPTGRAAVLVYGLDELPKEAKERAFFYLNLEREIMRLAGRSVVLFIKSDTVPELMRRAPDFCAWSSGLFDFRAPSDELAKERELAAFHLLLAGSDLEKLRQRYLEYLVNEYEWLDFRGILQLRTIVRVKLDDIYVPLWAMTRPSPLYAPLSERRVELRKALSENERVVVLGDPGSGKTTLLKHLALSLAQGEGKKVGLEDGLLPVLLPISAYADALMRRAELELVDFLPRYFTERGLPDLSPLFTRELKRGRCLLLLDGLDEVVREEMRLEVARRLGDLVSRYPDNRYMVTSRIAGYRPGLLSEDFAHFTILPFDDPEIKRFARQWCYAYEGMGAPELTPEAKRRAEERTESLIAAITSKEAIKRLAANPLLVTILALIHYQGTRLPHRRVELYRLCVEALAETWNLARSLTGRPIDLWLGENRLDERLVVGILAPIAFWMHSERPGGLVGREELEGRIAAYFEEREGKSPEEARKLAHDFVELIREQSGLLVERGLDQFGFMHLTFEEYLAARHLTGRRNVNELVKERLHNARWREVILLTAGTLRGDFADDLVEAIWKAKGPYDDILHRDLLMAARCLADDVDVSYDLRRRILDELSHLWRTTRYEKLRQETVETLVAMRGSACEGEVVRALLGALRDEDSDVRWNAAWALSELGEASDEVIVALLGALRDEDASVRMSAAWALGELGRASDEVVVALLIALRDEDAGVRGSAAWALGKFGQASGEVVGALLDALRDENAPVRWSAALALRELGKASDEVVSALLVALRDEDTSVHWNAAWALGELGEASEEVVVALLDALKDKDADVSVRMSAAWALGELGRASDEVVGALLGALRDEDVFVRRRATEALGELGEASDEVIGVLLDALRDEDTSVRGWAAVALGKLGEASEEVVVALLDALKDKDAGVRGSAAWALGELGEASDEVVSALLGALGDEDAGVRRRAAEALGKLGEASDEVVGALLGALRDEDVFVRRRATEALGELGEASDEVVVALLGALRDEDVFVRRRATEALGELGEASDEVVGALLGALRDEDVFVRRRATEALGELGEASDEVVAALLGALRDEDVFVRRSAAWALGELGEASEEVVRALMAALRDKDAGVRREAAWALGELGEASEEVVASLAKALRSRSAGMVASAAVALSKLGWADEGIIQTLAGLLRDRKGLLGRFFGPRMDEPVSVGFRHAPAYDFVFEALWELAGQRMG
jgi:HEAT repeat protein/energy-coupling factor transporter ATP-binding protein EcfA2